MSLLSYYEIINLIDAGVVVGCDKSAVNATSLDIHLGKTILWESPQYKTIDYSQRDPVEFNKCDMTEDGWVLQPGDFILTQSKEVFNLPDNISAEYKLKSSMARIGLEHMNAGWCDAGWNSSVLTLEFKNMCRYHSIRIRPGDPIGQMVFFKHQTVPDYASYSKKGRYNGDDSVRGIKP